MPPISLPASGSEIAASRLRDERDSLVRYVVTLLAPDLRHVEDIVQETLLRAWLRADQLEWQDRPIRPWLFRTARNLSVDVWRKDRAIPVGNLWNVRQDTPYADDLAERIVDRHVLVLALRRLPRVHREVLVYVHMLGLGGEEVADTLRIPRGTVKSRTHNAMRSLRRELGALRQEDDERAAA
jgi:RNA polymerase sigma-70 factor (ECF subfamily)